MKVGQLVHYGSEQPDSETLKFPLFQSQMHEMVYDDGSRTRDESCCTGVTQKFNIFGTHNHYNQHSVLMEREGSGFTKGLE